MFGMSITYREDDSGRVFRDTRKEKEIPDRDPDDVTLESLTRSQLIKTLMK